ncbi:hypothetical protein [Sporolactobacillus pectinivorans]|uniref:hypothetical protein n=1 Tax=Sporolactobacillus pectinivorans TaxID=1591408 RepID=UPI0012FE09F2|nr:hypothetical protein [Sporolactobacillus pectinivorans]
MKLIFVLLTVIASVFLFYHYLLGLLHLESLLISGGLFFLTVFLLIRLLTWRQRN